MADIVKLTRCLGAKKNVIVNLDHVIIIFENDHGSEILYDDKAHQFVTETLDQILALRSESHADKIS